jgi:hypothetical protein
MYAEPTIDVKRPLLNAVIEQARCTVKRGEKTGEIELRLRGNGSTKKKWDEAKEANGESGTLPSGSPTPHVALLRERLENSNYILLKIPVEIHLFERGLQAIRMDPARLPQMLGLSDQDIERLHQVGLVRVPPPTPRAKERIDYVVLQQTYARMLAEGPFASQAELARHLGARRVWVSRVLKGIRRREARGRGYSP